MKETDEPFAIPVYLEININCKKEEFRPKEDIYLDFPIVEGDISVFHHIDHGKCYQENCGEEEWLIEELEQYRNEEPSNNTLEKYSFINSLKEEAQENPELTKIYTELDKETEQTILYEEVEDKTEQTYKEVEEELKKTNFYKEVEDEAEQTYKEVEDEIKQTNFYEEVEDETEQTYKEVEDEIKQTNFYEEVEDETEQTYKEVEEEIKQTNLYEEVEDKTEQTNKEVEEDKTTTSSSIIFEDKNLSVADMFVCEMEMCHRVFSNEYTLESHQHRVHKLSKKPKIKERKVKAQKNKDVWPPNVQELARRVNGVKMFFCNFCSYSVNRCDSMTKHMLRIHSEGRTLRQYQCEVCGKTFIDKAYLRNHGISHLTEQLYHCEVCGRGFHRQPSLKRHQMGHSTEKQFACRLCDYKTNRKHLMYKHVEHHKTGRAYICQICGVRCYTQLSYRSHMYSHKLTPNACSFCKVNFSSRERMLCHMAKTHFNCIVKDLNDDVIPDLSKDFIKSIKH